MCFNNLFFKSNKIQNLDSWFFKDKNLVKFINGWFQIVRIGAKNPQLRVEIHLVTKTLRNSKAPDDSGDLHQFLLRCPVIRFNADRSTGCRVVFVVRTILVSAVNLNEENSEIFSKLSFQQTLYQLPPDPVSLSPRHPDHPLASHQVELNGQSLDRPFRHIVVSANRNIKNKKALKSST